MTDREDNMQDFLPVCRADMEKRGWDVPDFVYVTGDAYVDHSSFGTAIISRLLERFGYRVCILAQPDWRDDRSIREFGEPRLGFLVSAGNMDSMVNHFTVFRKRRKTDAYSPGGKTGLRPDRAVLVYGNGMGEHSIIEIAEALNSGIPVDQITFVRGTCYKTKEISDPEGMLILPDFPDMEENPRKYAQSFGIQYRNTDPFTASPMAEEYPGKGFVVQNPPALPLTQQEMDDVYDLPFTGKAHPMYDKDGGIPALSEVRFSLTSNRGCFGGCSFCALTFHEGRIVQTRSHESILSEARRMIQDPDFKGYIHDVGGPTADFRSPSCQKQLKKGVCPDRQCLFPKPCPNLKVDHSDYLSLLRKIRSLPGVKKVFIRSGIRFDYLMADKDLMFKKWAAALNEYSQNINNKFMKNPQAALAVIQPGKYLALQSNFRSYLKDCGVPDFLGECDARQYELYTSGLFSGRKDLGVVTDIAYGHWNYPLKDLHKQCWLLSSRTRTYYLLPERAPHPSPGCPHSK